MRSTAKSRRVGSGEGNCHRHTHESVRLLKCRRRICVPSPYSIW
jgi:hypothetical protein